ncbi:hypothetical protein H5410_038711 [Solanum commersonii]|uniref:PGG domain-containing protein n=1 Tax=Solanum commersonii TaxID=4109 RepID=A0A9J5YC58_SOLCO|nr:hypothetical protein H5410_038711 [Solanum commersonii]
MKSTQMHIVVATLIMTVTFAAGFTLPGGGLYSDEVDVFKETKVKVFLRNYRALQVLAMGAVVVAFVTGMYATLAKSLGLAVTVPVCVIGSVSYLIYYLISTTKRR